MPKIDNCKTSLPSLVCDSKCGPLADGVYTNARVTVECGCITDIQSGTPFVLKPDPCCDGSGGGGGGSDFNGISTIKTTTITFSGNGTSSRPLGAEVNLSTDSGNILRLRNGGLYAESTPASNTVVTKTTATIQMSGIGTVGQPVQGNVIVNPAADNALSATTSGLYVKPQAVNFSANAGNIIVNGVDGKPGAFIQTEAMWESPDPVYLTGLGNTQQKLGTRLTLSGELLNALQTKYIVDSEGHTIPSLYAKEETSILEMISGIGTSGAGSTGCMIRNHEQGKGRVLWVGPVSANATSGGVARPTVNVSSISVSGYVPGYGYVTSTGSGTGAVDNLTPFYVTIPLPSGYTWNQAAAISTDSKWVALSTVISGTTATIYCYEIATTVSAGPKTFMIILQGYDPSVSGEFGP